MTRALPDAHPLRVPFAVDLPAGWVQVDPALAESGQTALVAVRDGCTDGLFTPTITLDVDTASSRPDLGAIAEAAAAATADGVHECVVLDRRPLGRTAGHAAGGSAHGMAQVLLLRLPELPTALVQSQVHLGVALDDDGNTLVVQLTCTATLDQTAVVAAEFEQFVASLRLRTPQEG